MDKLEKFLEWINSALNDIFGNWIAYCIIVFGFFSYVFLKAFFSCLNRRRTIRTAPDALEAPLEKNQLHDLTKGAVNSKYELGVIEGLLFLAGLGVAWGAVIEAKKANKAEVYAELIARDIEIIRMAEKGPYAVLFSRPNTRLDAEEIYAWGHDVINRTISRGSKKDGTPPVVLEWKDAKELWEILRDPRVALDPAYEDLLASYAMADMIVAHLSGVNYFVVEGLLDERDAELWWGYIQDVGIHPLFASAIHSWDINKYFSSEDREIFRQKIIGPGSPREVRKAFELYYPGILSPGWGKVENSD